VKVLSALRRAQDIICVGIVGLKGAGKTTMIQQVFGVEARGEAFDRLGILGTQRTQVYAVEDKLIVDYPGSDESLLEAQRDFEERLIIASIAVILIDGSNKDAGTEPTRQFIEKMIQATRPFLICFTQIDRLNDLGHLVAWRDQLIEALKRNSPIIASHLERNASRLDDLVWLCAFKIEARHLPFLQPAVDAGIVKTCEHMRAYVAAIGKTPESQVFKVARSCRWNEGVCFYVLNVIFVGIVLFA
jgi:GTP-binding protein EngB required for normal cell division